MGIDKINDEFIVNCTNNSREERQQVYKFHPEDRYIGEGDNEELFSWGLEMMYTERKDTYEEALEAGLQEGLKLIK